MKILMFGLLILSCPQYIIIGCVIDIFFENYSDKLYKDFPKESLSDTLGQILLWPVTLIKIAEKVKL
jgi:hypothetical protein